jgi:hypothetical protein
MEAQWDGLVAVSVRFLLNAGWILWMLTVDVGLRDRIGWLGKQNQSL